MSDSSPPTLSVIVIMFNMQREAKRTLYSLSSEYQREVDSSSWEVLVVDNGSSAPLSEQEVAQYGVNFRYFYFDTNSRSPVQAINFAVTHAKGELVSVCIDGARILTPGILRYTLDCFNAFKNPFVCTLGWHLGKEIQNISMMKGYNQSVEDAMLDSVDWRNNGYLLFNIASLAGSSAAGYFSPIVESNFYTLKKTTYEQAYGYDIRFSAPGGGTANLDFYKRISERSDVQTVHLLGEGTFHQFHGGVTTNVSVNLHPKTSNRIQYEKIRGEKYSKPNVKPVYFGKMQEQAIQYLYNQRNRPLFSRICLQAKRVVRSVFNSK